VVRIDTWILFVLSWAAIPVGLFAFIHAAVQKADAFAAAGKRTKPFWLGVTAGGTVACAVFQLYGPIGILWIPGLVAVLVYIVDVKPAVAEVQRGSQW
jgi:hypothetical protein